MSKPDSASNVPDLAAWLHAAARDLGLATLPLVPPAQARDTLTAYLAAAVDGDGPSRRSGIGCPVSSATYRATCGGMCESRRAGN